MRRTIAKVRPLRRAGAAGKADCGVEGMPPTAIRPPRPGTRDGGGQGVVGARHLDHHVDAASGGGLVDPRAHSSGAQAASAPHRSAVRRRCSSGSLTKTRRAPARRATGATSTPMGPPPTTSTSSPGRTWPILTAWMATPSGSSSAPASSLSASGRGCSRRVGHSNRSCRPPSRRPWPANWTSGQRLACPARHCSHLSHGIAGSTATRRPACGPSSATPPNSCPAPPVGPG